MHNFIEKFADEKKFAKFDEIEVEKSILWVAKCFRAQKRLCGSAVSQSDHAYVIWKCHL